MSNRINFLKNNLRKFSQTCLLVFFTIDDYICNLCAFFVFCERGGIVKVCNLMRLLFNIWYYIQLFFKEALIKIKKNK